ncbi:CorA family divalent cation transporter [Dokdonella sp.]|uniref:CorA family divalent cation transporter n=1 Tax=Dokdonella sp. TaxID=2291710 RepID=UPI001B1CB343|nr:CorA family divalent cation transporter [Dokdonella sp.]MBO9662820.1 magnesium transporter [Dokdonella sp.]
MLTHHGADGRVLTTAADGRSSGECRWFDLRDPTAEEVRDVERSTGLSLPTQERIRAVEMSSRARLDGDVLYLNVPYFAHDVEQRPVPFGLIVAPKFLVSIRYGDSPAFRQATNAVHETKTPDDGAGVFVALLEALVGEIADHLEAITAQTADLSLQIMGQPKHSTRTLTGMLKRIGELESALTRARQTMSGLGRIVGFMQENAPPWVGKPQLAQLKVVHKDLDGLGELDSHMTDKLQFLLDAVLGFINIEQNDVIKILTVASVVSIPPVILAGIWGMNFVNMRELKLPYGYPLALVAIVLSAVLPLYWFKRRGWL